MLLICAQSKLLMVRHFQDIYATFFYKIFMCNILPACLAN